VLSLSLENKSYHECTPNVTLRLGNSYVEFDVADDGKEKLEWVLYLSLNVKIVLFFEKQ
jgi:hypothetical protein